MHTLDENFLQHVHKYIKASEVLSSGFVGVVLIRMFTLYNKYK